MLDFADDVLRFTNTPVTAFVTKRPITKWLTRQYKQLSELNMLLRAILLLFQSIASLAHRSHFS